jgi:hypothetical protein
LLLLMLLMLLLDLRMLASFDFVVVVVVGGVIPCGDAVACGVVVLLCGTLSFPHMQAHYTRPASFLYGGRHLVLFLLALPWLAADANRGRDTVEQLQSAEPACVKVMYRCVLVRKQTLLWLQLSLLLWPPANTLQARHGNARWHVRGCVSHRLRAGISCSCSGWSASATR